jgi:signal transduction histidine kinase
MPNDFAPEQSSLHRDPISEIPGFERLLAELLENFINLPADRVEAEIEGALARLLEFSGFDRCTFAEIRARDGSLCVLCSVAANGNEPMPLGPLCASLAWYARTIQCGRTIVMHDGPADLPREAAEERRYLERSGMRSQAVIPLWVGGKVFGAIGLASFRETRALHPELIVRLRMVGELLAAAVARARADTELRKLRAELWHADRAASAGALTGSLAHELNQPLTAILINAQAGLRFLDRGEAQVDARVDAQVAEIREILLAIVSEDKRASAIIQGLRAMLRREAGARARIDLAEAFGEVLVLMRGELDAHRVQLETRFEPGCVVLADKTQLQQVALNLIKNALEAMLERPSDARRLRLSIAREGARAIGVSVRDSGPGLAAEKLQSVFEPFRSTKEQGMGLGLSISRAIVDAHGGEIRAESNEDCGVTIRFSLPAAALVLQHAIAICRDSGTVRATPRAASGAPICH